MARLAWLRTWAAILVPQWNAAVARVRARRAANYGPRLALPVPSWTFPAGGAPLEMCVYR